MRLAGLLIIREGRGSLVRAARREIRRVGLLKFADVLAFRLYSRLALARSDGEWRQQELRRLRALYPSNLDTVPRLVVSSPNTPEAKAFLEQLRPDLVIARCKVILKREIYDIPTTGTFVLHPGICPEYRNAHGCFWALANGEPQHVGMTLLRVDPGIDTGPIYLQATCRVDEIRESHTIVQYRVVTENLDAIGRALLGVWRGEQLPMSTAGRKSATWGQPRLTDYLRWKRSARARRRTLAARPSEAVH
jgi:methionyl-tRNA formyltransferase